MRAVQVSEFGGPEVLKVVTVPLAETSEGQVQVQVHAAGVNPVDAYIRSGTYQTLPGLPYIPGKDAAGVVTALGAGVSHLYVGQRVYVAGLASGAYAEALVCPSAAVHGLPEFLDFTQGAAVGIPYGTACYALFFRAKAKFGETVLVHGATGAVGLAAVQFALAAGLTVLATGGSPEGRRLVANQGPVQVFDHHDGDRMARIMEATEGRGVDLVLEMMANVNLATDLEILAKGGRVAVIGSRGPIRIDPRAAMQRNAAILGTMIAHATGEEMRGIHAAIGAGLANGALKPVVARTYMLEEAAAAHSDILTTKAAGKLVLVTQEK
jgi:NADPH2:quinone reductase